MSPRKTLFVPYSKEQKKALERRELTDHLPDLRQAPTNSQALKLVTKDKIGPTAHKRLRTTSQPTSMTKADQLQFKMNASAVKTRHVGLKWTAGQITSIQEIECHCETIPL